MALTPMHSVRRLSDAELLDAEFHFVDPENTISGLNRNVPDPDSHPTIIGYYDETPPGGRKARTKKPFVRCCHCGKRRHWIGFVVRDDRGQTYIIGSSHCGREHYGARFEEAERTFKEERQRKAVVIRWRSMLLLLPAYERELEFLLASPSLALRERKRNELRRASPTGFANIERMAELGDALVDVRDVRDLDAEHKRKEKFDRALATYEALPSWVRRERRDEGLKPEPDERPIFRRETHALGHLIGTGFITPSTDIRHLAIELRATIRAIRGLDAKDTNRATLSEMQRLLREMTDRPRALRSALITGNFDSAFFEPDNLDRLERWSHGKSHFAYSSANGNLIVNDSSNGRSVITPLSDCSLPVCEEISAAVYLDEEFCPALANAA